MIRNLALALAVSLASLDLSVAQNRLYPIKPDPNVTPGRLCDHADQIRYPEMIRYCERHVETHVKVRIIQIYDTRFGYTISRQNRADFKIDHYIPLCMGGSNDVQNLWPQHKSIYQHTDPLEALLCEKMKFGRLRQLQAIELIRRAKNDLSQVRQIIDYASRL